MSPSQGGVCIVQVKCWIGMPIMSGLVFGAISGTWFANGSVPLAMGKVTATLLFIGVTDTADSDAISGITFEFL